MTDMFETSKDPAKITPVDILKEKLGYCQIEPFFPPTDPTCLVCGKVSTSIQQALKHAYIHDPVCQFKCEPCNNQLFQTPTTLITHKRNKHKKEYDSWQVTNQAWRARTCFVREQKMKKDLARLSEKAEKAKVEKGKVEIGKFGKKRSLRNKNLENNGDSSDDNVPLAKIKREIENSYFYDTKLINEKTRVIEDSKSLHLGKTYDICHDYTAPNRSLTRSYTSDPKNSANSTVMPASSTETNRNSKISKSQRTSKNAKTTKNSNTPQPSQKFKIRPKHFIKIKPANCQTGSKDASEVVKVDIVKEKILYLQIPPFFPPDPLKPNDCTVCGKTCQGKIGALVHAYVHDLTPQFKCSICNDRPMQSSVGLLMHYNNTHREEYLEYKKFTTENKQMVKQDWLNQGKKLATIKIEELTGAMFVCKLCNKQFKTENRLKRHEELKHTVTDKDSKTITSGDKFTCKYCQKVFGSSQLHKQHEEKLCEMNTMLKMQYKCQFCEESFDTANERDGHQKPCGVLRLEETRSKRFMKRAVWDRKVDEKDEGISKENQGTENGSKIADVNGKKTSLRGKSKKKNQQIDKNTKSTKFIRRKFKNRQEPNTPKFTNLSTNDSSSSNNDEFPNEGGNCKFCQKELPSGRRLCIHENYCRHRPASTITFDNEATNPLPLFENAMAEKMSEDEISDNDIMNENQFNEHESDHSLGKIIAETCARQTDNETEDLSVHAMNVQDTVINDSGIQNLELAEEELIFSTNQKHRSEQHEAETNAEINTDSNALFNAQSNIQTNTEILQFNPAVPIRTKIEPSASDASLCSDKQNTFDNEHSLSKMATNDDTQNENLPNENLDAPERKPKTEAMMSSAFLNEFNVDAYIASNAAVGNLDVLEVDSIENFTMS